jgi:hypothetical protein
VAPAVVVTRSGVPDHNLFILWPKKKPRRLVQKKILTLPSSLWLLPWSLLDPACQIYGGLLVRIGTAGVLHLNVHKIKTATF